MNPKNPANFTRGLFNKGEKNTLWLQGTIKVVPDQSGKVEYEREINFLATPSSLSRSYSTFPLCSGTTLIEIPVYSG
jgi:hypothetical protein